MFSFDDCLDDYLNWRYNLYNFGCPIPIRTPIVPTPNPGAPFSLIKYEAEIEISENLEEYEKAKRSQKALDPTPSP